MGKREALGFYFDQGGNHLGLHGTEKFPGCETFHAKTRKVLGKLAQVGHPNFGFP